jgi:hypothetical protein
MLERHRSATLLSGQKFQFPVEKCAKSSKSKKPRNFRGYQIVPQLDLGALALHDHALLQDRQRVVPAQ